MARVTLAAPKIEFQKTAIEKVWESAMDAYFDRNCIGVAKLELALGAFLARLEPDLTLEKRHKLLHLMSASSNYEDALSILGEFLRERSNRAITFKRLGALGRVKVKLASRN